MTTKKDVLTKLRAIIASLKSDPTKKGMVRVMRRAVKRINGSFDAGEMVSATDDAFSVLKSIDGSTVAANDSDWLDAVQTLHDAWGELPLNDTDPSVLDKKKVIRQSRRILSEAVDAMVIGRAEHYVRNVFGDKKSTDPCEVEALKAANDLSNNIGTMTAEEVAEALRAAERCV